MKHLLDTRELTREEPSNPRRRRLRPAQVKPKTAPSTCSTARPCVNLFFGDSTRTASPFEAAGKRLGAAVATSLLAPPMSKGESLRDLRRPSRRLPRTPFIDSPFGIGAPGACSPGAGWTDIPMLNMGGGTYARHRALLDAVSLRQLQG